MSLAPSELEEKVCDIVAEALAADRAGVTVASNLMEDLGA